MLFKNFSNVFSLILFFMNLYLILHVFFSNESFGFSYRHFHFFSKILEEFRVWIAEKGTNSNNKKVLFSQWGVSAPNPPAGASPPCSPHQGMRLWTRSLPPYILSFPLHTQPSRIGEGGFSSLCVRSLCRTLHTKLHKITYATRAYFFTHSDDRRALVARA